VEHRLLHHDEREEKEREEEERGQDSHRHLPRAKVSSDE
jgi:hypothetical protein